MAAKKKAKKKKKRSKSKTSKRKKKSSKSTSRKKKAKPKKRARGKGQKRKSDTTAGELEIVQALAEGEPPPPGHIKLRDQDWPFYLDIVRSRALETWTDADLVLAAQLARCRADIEELQAVLEREGFITVNSQGEAPHPATKLLDQYTKRELAIARALHVHAHATQGRSRDTGERLKAQKRVEQGMKKTTPEGDGEVLESLIAPPVVH